MKTALQTVKKEIAELWSSPGDNPNYTQIFEVLERNEPLFRQQIIDAFSTCYNCEGTPFDGEQYYNETFNQPLKGI